MALPSAIKLFINPRTGLAFGNFNGSSQITNPVVTLGDTARFEIYLVEDTGISSYPRQEVAFPGTPGIKIAVGPIDESPQAGTWKVSFGGDTTSALAYNITATALAAAMNALASITAAGGVSVSKIGDNYNIVFNENGARGDILTDGAALIPLSTATVAKLQIGDSTRPQIALVHLQRTIAGLATSFTATAASAIAVENLSAWDGIRATYRASIAPDPKGGSFTLAFDAATGTDVSGPAIAVGASATDVQNALNVGALVDKVSVTQIGAYVYDITVTAEPGTGGLTASSAGLISFSGYVGELSLNTAEAISLLDGADEVQTTLEVEITSESKTLTVLQIPCTLKNAVIDPGSIQPLVLDTYLSQALADGRYARQANNLSDLEDTSAARTNLGVYSTSSVDTALALKYDASNPDGFITSASFSDYARTDGATFTGGVSFTWSLEFQDNGYLDVSGVDSDGRSRIRFGPFSGGASYIAWGDLSFNGTNLIYGNGQNLPETVASRSWVNAGVTFYGKTNFTSVNGAAGLNIGIGGTSASATVNGDIWIPTAGTNLNFRDGKGIARVCASTTSGNTFNQPQIVDTSNAAAALRVTQRGSGLALVVEDGSTINPDLDATVIDANGNLGIGVNSSTWAASEKVEVNGNIKATAFKNGSGPTFAVVSTTSHTGGSDTHDLLISIGGSTYRVGLRFVSTP